MLEDSDRENEKNLTECMPGQERRTAVGQPKRACSPPETLRMQVYVYSKKFPNSTTRLANIVVLVSASQNFDHILYR